MGQITSSLNIALGLARERRFGEISSRLNGRIMGRWTSLGFKRDLSIPFTRPEAKIPLRVRPLQTRDVDQLFSMPEDATPEVKRDVIYRREMRDASFETCFVAVTEEDVPCYMQWLIPADSNDHIQSFFKSRFPVLRSNEMLLEGAYVPPSFRGLGIMPAAMALISEQAQKFGADTVVTFVEHDNIPSLKGCRRSGYSPYLIRRDEWYFTPKLRRLRFIPLEEYRLKPAVPEWLLS